MAENDRAALSLTARRPCSADWLQSPTSILHLRQVRVAAAAGSLVRSLLASPIPSEATWGIRDRRDEPAPVLIVVCALQRNCRALPMPAS